MSQKNYTGIDVFRLVAAFFIIAIHTAPLKGIDMTLDFLVTYCIGRIGVPFFLMVAGYFVLSSSASLKRRSVKSKRYLIKLLFLYVVATILYLPINLYAGKRPGNIWEMLKAFVFDGTFYHLWYLPAAILGCIILLVLFKFCSMRAVGIISGILYLVGTLGDSYYGLVKSVGFIDNLYELIFRVSSYTRNGIFYAPIFLWLGVLAAQKERERKPWTGLAVSLVLMLAEGLFTYRMGWQKHNSMYIMLVPVMYFLFALLLDMGGKKDSSFQRLREVSLWVYLLHPICIILVRGGARVVHMTELLVDNSLVHYVAVCVLSVILAEGVYLLKQAVFKGRGKGASDGTKKPSLDRTL